MNREQTNIILESYAKDFFPDNILDIYQPLEIGKLNVQVIPSDVDAFLLDPVSGYIKVIKGEDNKNNSAIVRVILGYISIIRIIESCNKRQFNYLMSLVTNSVITELTKQMGNLENRIITVRRPSETIFFGMDNAMAYELRFYLKKQEK